MSRCIHRDWLSLLSALAESLAVSHPSAYLEPVLTITSSTLDRDPPGTNIVGTLTFTGVGSLGTVSYAVIGNISDLNTVTVYSSSGSGGDLGGTFDSISRSFNIAAFEGYTPSSVFRDGGT